MALTNANLARKGLSPSRADLSDVVGSGWVTTNTPMSIAWPTDDSGLSRAPTGVAHEKDSFLLGLLGNGYQCHVRL